MYVNVTSKKKRVNFAKNTRKRVETIKKIRNKKKNNDYNNNKKNDKNKLNVMSTKTFMNIVKKNKKKTLLRYVVFQTKI